MLLFENHKFVLPSTLCAMYLKCGCVKASATLQLRKYPLDLVLSSISAMEAIGKVAVSGVWCVDVVGLPRKQSCVGSG